MRRPSFPVRGVTTRLTAPAMVIRSWWTRVLLLWPSRNGNGNTFLSTKGREGPRRRSRATAGKATAERQLQGFFFVLRGQKGCLCNCSLQRSTADKKNRSWCCSSALALLQLQFFAALRGPSRKNVLTLQLPFVDKKVFASGLTKNCSCGQRCGEILPRVWIRQKIGQVKCALMALNAHLTARMWTT